MNELTKKEKEYIKKFFKDFGDNSTVGMNHARIAFEILFEKSISEDDFLKELCQLVIDTEG